MRLAWDRSPLADIDRLYAFLALKSPPQAAKKAAVAISSAPEVLLQQPRLGPRIEASVKEEVRRLIVGQYEIWYAIRDQEVRVMRVFHVREDR
jgi:plasmid stabilization system protein ParE